MVKYRASVATAVGTLALSGRSTATASHDVDSNTDLRRERGVVVVVWVAQVGPLSVSFGLTDLGEETRWGMVRRRGVGAYMAGASAWLVASALHDLKLPRILST